jgi:acylpyruvate hydrolase
MAAAPSTFRLASFALPDGHETSGLEHDGRLVELAGAFAAVHGPSWDGRDPAVHEWLREPHRLELFLGIESWEAMLAPVAGGLAELAASGEVPSWPVSEGELRSPVRRPEKIVAVGLNYVSHAEEAERELPQYPMLFAKFANTLTGPSADIPIPRASHRIDYEGELAIVIGRTTKHAGRDDADGCVAGYAIANDVSARDYQFRTREMLQGKTFDDFCPLGPWITKPVALDALGTLHLQTSVNGEVRQAAKLGEMLFDVPFLIEYLSAFMTLRPGDVVLTGTPAGIGATMSPRRWLRDGDVVEVRIDGIGAIRNTFVAGTDRAGPEA